MSQNILAQALFSENKGQWPSWIHYRCKLPNGYLYITPQKLLFVELDQNAFKHGHHKNNIPKDNSSFQSKTISEEDPEFIPSIKGHRYVMEMINSNSNAYIIPSIKKSYTENYYIGNNQKTWTSNVHVFEKITIHNLYNGIDMEISSIEGKYLKYQYILKNDAQISDIQIQYHGLDKMELKNNELFLYTSLGTTKDEHPISWYQDSLKEIIQINYNIKKNIVGFEGHYNNNRPIIIDPKLVFSSLSGSTADNWGLTATYDTFGHGYAGSTIYDYKPNGQFPATLGAFQTSFQGGYTSTTDPELSRDIGIIKYNPDGKGIVYATYVGGSHNEQPHSMVVNHAGELCVLASTWSTDFPIKGTNVAQKTLKGESDIVIFKLDSAGKKMIVSTFIGGTKRDGLNGKLYEQGSDLLNESEVAWNYGDIYRGEIVVDNDDNIYIASSTQSSEFNGLPVSNAFQLNTGGGKQDGCVFKLTSDLSKIIWGTYIGGNDWDDCNGLFIDHESNVFVCGGTKSETWKHTFNGLNKTYNGGRVDGYIIKISNNGTLMNATFVGTTGYDQAFLIQADRNGNPYVFGQTDGKYPVTLPIYNNPGSGMFISKFNPDLSKIIRSTVFGSGRSISDISPSAFLVDRCERVFVSGWGGTTNSPDKGGHGGRTTGMPITNDAFDKNTDGSDFYLGVFSRNLDTILFGTFFGGHEKNSQLQPLAEHVDGGTSRFDYDGKVYQSVCAGCGGSVKGFPTTPGAFSETNNSGNCNNALFKIDFENFNKKPSADSNFYNIYASDTLMFEFNSTDPDKYDSIFIRPFGNIFGPPSNLPYATMPADSGQGSAKSIFKWYTGCSNITTDTAIINIIIHDNNICPKPDSNFAQFKIIVKPPPKVNPPKVVCVAHIDFNSAKVSWEGLDTGRYWAYYLLYRIDPLGNIIVLDTIYPGDFNEYTDPNCPNHQVDNYCYCMQGINICNNFGDTSYKACSADEAKFPIQVSDMIRATVVNNSKVRIEWEKSNEPDFGNYLIFKHSRTIPPSTIIYKAIENINETWFEDSLVNVADSSYCYSLRVTDKCGHISGYSNQSCNIVLSGISKPYEHHLSWMDYQKWLNGTDYFKLYRNDSSIEFKEIELFSGTTQNHIDSTMFYDWGSYCYRVDAYENSGNKAVSQSNSICLIQKPLLWVPNAFTPNDDQLNDVWGYLPIYVKDFYIAVYNRWGEKVFETNNRHEQWDGSYKGVNFDNNLYIWYARYTGWDGSQHADHGIVYSIK